MNILLSILRCLLFWSLFAASLVGFDWSNPWFSLGELSGPLSAAFDGEFDRLSDRRFAFSLAWSIAGAGVAFAMTYLVFHVAWIWWILSGATRTIERLARGSAGIDRLVFAGNYEAIREKLRGHRLIGHAYREFDETLVEERGGEGVICNTVRPQIFINPGIARDQLAGLKFMNALPGYFVGVGLLLTFVGLVLALSKAGQAAEAASVDDMQLAVGELLQVATFKFATSIAGLGMSIFLAIVFRYYTILIEGYFHHFCRTLEKALLYKAPQSISLEMNETMKEQRDQLKEITQGDFFARMGAEIAPRLDQSLNDAFATLGNRIDASMTGALEPVTRSLEGAIADMHAQSESGVGKLLEDFSRSVQGSAGTEMRELAGTLKTMQESLAEMQVGIRGTGEDFGRRMADAAENLNRMVGEAGANLGQSSVESSKALAEVVGGLRATMESANSQIGVALGEAAGGASSKLEEAMGRVLERLEGQVGSFSDDFSRFQSGMRGEIEQTSQQVAAAQRQAGEALVALSGEMAGNLKTGMTEAMASVAAEFERLIGTLRTLEGSMQSQSNAITATTSETRKTADVFHETATSIRSAAQPLIQVGDRFGAASETLGTHLATTLETIRSAQGASEATAYALAEAQREVREFWSKYAESYRGIDQDLGRAVEALSTATTNHQQVLSKHVTDTDRGLADAVGKLQGLLEALKENAETFSESAEIIAQRLRQEAAE